MGLISFQRKNVMVSVVTVVSRPRQVPVQDCTALECTLVQLLAFIAIFGMGINVPCSCLPRPEHLADSYHERSERRSAQTTTAVQCARHSTKFSKWHLLSIEKASFYGRCAYPGTRARVPGHPAQSHRLTLF